LRCGLRKRFGRALGPLLQRPATHVVTDLGMSPLCERHLRASQLNAMEPLDPHGAASWEVWNPNAPPHD